MKFTITLPEDRSEETVEELRLRLGRAEVKHQLDAQIIALYLGMLQEQARLIERQQATLTWLQREHPLPVGDLNPMIEEANEAARGLGA